MVFAISFSLNLAGVYSGKAIHRKLLITIISAPGHFFDKTPTGRILNRFGHDTNVIDFNLPRNIRGWCFQLFRALTVPIVIGYSTPLFLVTIPPVIVIYLFHQVFLKELFIFAMVTLSSV